MLRASFTPSLGSFTPKFKINNKSKGKIHHRTGPEGPEVDSTLSITSALNRVGGQRHAPAALPPGKTRYALYWRVGGPQGWCGIY